MRVIDLYLPTEQGDEVRARAETQGHVAVTLSERDGYTLTRIVVKEGDPDEFLEATRAEVREQADPLAHYVTFEPSAVEPRPETDESSEEQVAGTEEIESFVGDGARVDRTFLLLSALAGVLATGGLLLDNAAVLVGAMVIAPIFKPLALVGTAATLGRPRQMIRGLRAALLSLAIGAAVGAAVTWATPGTVPTAQLEARTGITAFDLVIAFAAGLAMAHAILRSDAMAMIGIVVAASIVPVAAALGATLAMGRWELAEGATFTLSSNLCGVLLGLIAGLRLEQLRGLTPEERELGERWSKRSLVVGTALAAVLLGLAAWTYVEGDRTGRRSDDYWSRHPGVRAWWRAADGQAVVVPSSDADSTTLRDAVLLRTGASPLSEGAGD